MDKLLTTPQIAELLQVAPSTVRAWVLSRRIPFVRVGRRAIRFDARAETKFVQAVPALRPLHDAESEEGGVR